MPYRFTPSQNLLDDYEPTKKGWENLTICTCQTFLYYVNLPKTNFAIIFKIHFRSKKISKSIMGPQTFKPHHIFFGNAYPHRGFFLPLAETWCLKFQKPVFCGISERQLAWIIYLKIKNNKIYWYCKSISQKTVKTLYSDLNL